MNFGQSITYCFSNYFNFNGRGSRSEYWWFILFCMILELGGSVWDASMGDMSGNGFMYWLAVAATFFPSIAAASRRLHDINKSGWWQLIALTIIGLIPLIIWLASVGIHQKQPPARVATCKFAIRETSYYL